MVMREEEARHLPIGRLVGVGVLVLVVLAFVLQNRDPIRVSFLVFDFTIRLWLLIVLVHLLGIGVGLFVPGYRRHHRKG